jgi:phosphoribosyl 1,2-cyclic phosphodiesterase
VIVRNLGSGSGGNATVVAHEGRAILIDAGLSRRRMLAGLDGLALDAVLITHVHRDHLGAQAARLGAPVWIDAANHRAAGDRLEDAEVRHFHGAPFEAGPFRVTPFPLPHPGGKLWGTWGFRIERGGLRMAYATDLGHAPPEVVEALSGAQVVFLESNHDPEMERASSRPPDLVDWVLSDTGHLSNEQCAEALSKLGHPHTVILGHLSEDCNTPSLALRSARKAVPRAKRVLVAFPREGAEVVRV